MSGFRVFDWGNGAVGWNSVKREGISISHHARFILVGSGRSLVGSRVFRSGVGFCLLEVCQGLGF